jgi:ArsR family transcriptional regulator
MQQRRRVPCHEPARSAEKPAVELGISEDDAITLARLFAVLADPVRLRLLSIVALHPHIPSRALEGPLSRTQPTISHHCRVLAEAGLLVREGRGQSTTWRAVPEWSAAISAVMAEERYR